MRKIFTHLTVPTPDDKVFNTICTQSTPLIAINDTWCEDFEKKKETLHRAFDTILGDKSCFEL